MISDDYQLLEGRLSGPLYSTRLYIGKNHLLKSTIAGTHESYRRFAWEDIQAFTVMKTAWGGVVGLIAVLFLFIITMSFVTWHSRMLTSFFVHLPFFVFFLILFIRNQLMGPTCNVRIQTAVSDEWLGSLHRIKVARKVLDQLKPIIAANQKTATADGIEVGMNPIPDAAAAEPESNQDFRRKPKPQDEGRWQLGALILIFVNLSGNLSDIYSKSTHVYSDVIFPTSLCLSLLVSICVLVSQSKTFSNSRVKAFGWCNFGNNLFMIFSLMVTGLWIFVQKIKHPKTAFSSFDFRQLSIYHRMVYVETALLAILLVFGALEVLEYRRLKQVSPVGT